MRLIACLCGAWMCPSRWDALPKVILWPQASCSSISSARDEMLRPRCRTHRITLSRGRQYGGEGSILQRESGQSSLQPHELITAHSLYSCPFNLRRFFPAFQPHITMVLVTPNTPRGAGLQVRWRCCHTPCGWATVTLCLLACELVPPSRPLELVLRFP